MKLSAEPFQKIKSGSKVIESRLYDDKRKLISVGDEIEFSENEYPESKVCTKVLELLRYPTFAELFADNNPVLFGDSSRDSLLKIIRKYYSDDDEKKFGVVGIRIALVDKTA